MRIALSNASYSWGGIHVVTEILMRGLRRRGHEVVVFCRPESLLYARIRDQVACEPIVKGMDLGPRAVSACWRALRRHRTSVVLTLMEKDTRVTGPAAWSLGIPVVVRRANDRPLPQELHARFFYGTIPAHHVANSEATRRTMLDSAPWLRPERVTVIHNGIDPAPFESAAPANFDLPPGALAIGFVGRFDERKGLLDLLKAWPIVAAALPDAHLVLVGKGTLETQVQELAAADPRVHWAGYRTDVPSVMRALGILAMPSYWEGFGLSAIEAMASGVPVVATRISSLPELVNDGEEGRLVPVASPPALAEALIELGRDPEMRARMGRAGRERVRRQFSAERMLDAYEVVLQMAEGWGQEDSGFGIRDSGNT